MSDTELRDHVKGIASNLTNPDLMRGDDLWENGEPTAWEYSERALDVEYVISSQREFLGVRLLITFGGPNIWIDTRTMEVEGHWWGDKASAKFDDALDLHGYWEEIWNCQ